MDAESGLPQISRILAGALVLSVGRAADMGVMEFAAPDGGLVMAHIQCPFRIIQGRDLLLGSRDMRFSQGDVSKDAVDRFETVYDVRAAKLNSILGRLRPTVSTVEGGAGGSLGVGWSPEFHLEVFPDCSGSDEAWRVFIRGGPHYGFPPNSV